MLTYLSLGVPIIGVAIVAVLKVSDIGISDGWAIAVIAIITLIGLLCGVEQKMRLLYGPRNEKDRPRNLLE